MIEQGNLSLPVYKRIKDLIVEGKLIPGQKIKQEHLAKELGVSRTPLHKAFQMLENDFLVISIPRRGIFVREIDLNQIYDAFECREAIEGIAARRAARNITAEEIAELRGLFNPFRNSSLIDNLEEYQKADHHFHKKIIAISQNSILTHLDMLGNLLIRTYQKGLIRSPEETLSEHIEIIDALETGDSDKAEMLAKKHLRKSQESIKQMIQRSNQ